MKTINGDLIKLFKEDKFDVIVHGCNCMCTMGSGIAKSIRSNYPSAYEVDQKTIKGDRSKLGTISVVTLENDKVIINAYTQYGYGRDKVYVDYDAIRSCMREIKTKYAGKRIGLPKIGAGLAGGDWGIVSGIIDEELEGEDVVVVVY